MTLGKTYRQEGALSWGYLTPADDARSEHVRLTQPARSRARRSAGRSDLMAPNVEELQPVPDPLRCFESLARAAAPSVPRQRGAGFAD